VYMCQVPKFGADNQGLDRIRKKIHKIHPN